MGPAVTPDNEAQIMAAHTAAMTEGVRPRCLTNIAREKRSRYGVLCRAGDQWPMVKQRLSQRPALVMYNVECH